MAASARSKGPKMPETKPKLSQSDLRKLMKEKVEASERRKKKIESPFAKYNSGELFCVLCSTKIKSELLWAAHINGRIHKENHEILKRKKKEAEDLLMKRPSTPPPIKPVYNKQAVQPPAEKRQKLESVVSDLNSTKSSSSASDGNPAKGLISSYYEAEEEEEEDVASTSQLPPDFFDSGVPSEVPVEDGSKDEKNSEPSKKPATTAEALPEGFFDDPVLDAKVRKVEYKDPMDDEWDKFQKAIASESTVSQALMEENDEESKAERQIDEIDEQIHNWARVEALQRRKDTLNRKQESSTIAEQEEPVSTDEVAFDEFLDWRSKGAWR